MADCRRAEHRPALRPQALSGNLAERRYTARLRNIALPMGSTMHKLCTFAIGLLIAAGTDTYAAEIKVLSAKAPRPFLEELGPQFERATGHKVTISYDEAGIIRRRIMDGEPFDVTVLPAGWDDVRGKISGDPVGIGHTDFGLAVLARAPKPDTSSNETVKRTLLAATSIVYTDPS